MNHHAIATFFRTHAARRIARQPGLHAAAAKFEAHDWGDVPPDLAARNDNAVRDRGPVIGVYPKLSGEDLYLIEYICRCGHWGTTDRTCDVRVACTRYELLLATCPCVWSEIVNRYPAATFPPMPVIIRHAMDEVLRYVFDKEHELYASLPEDERAGHVLTQAALVEGWYNGTPDPVTALHNAVEEKVGLLK